MTQPKPPHPAAPHAPLLRRLPSVHRIASLPEIATLAANIPPSLLTQATRETLEAIRTEILAAPAHLPPKIPSEQEIAQRTAKRIQSLTLPTLRAAINATGVVLHTGLGRARLSEAAVKAICEVAGNHSLLEIDPETGGRGSRRDHVRQLLCELTGAEDAAVLNNCAGAVFLGVSALASGREAVISRGELVEIGGAFRMPDIIRASGATLIEVGTTNRTRLSDYANAINERTGLILRCHPSNFAMTGFVEETPLAELVALGAKHGVPVMDDQGSGAILSPAELGFSAISHSLGVSVKAGCALVAASGDKLLGGSQAGLVLGNKACVEKVHKHPLARALRVDKLTLAALEATLRLYRDPQKAISEIPTLRYLTRTEPELRRMAQKLAAVLKRHLSAQRFIIKCIAQRSEVGGGSLPHESLPTVCVSLKSTDSALSADAMAQRFRQGSPAVFARIQNDALLFDPRTLEPEEIPHIGRIAQRLFPEK